MAAPKRCRPAARALSAFACAALFYGACMSGVCLCGPGAAEGGRATARIVSLDVCGSGSASMAVLGLDAVLTAGVAPVVYFPSISPVPPMPEPAVASADFGDTEKPPEA